MFKLVVIKNTILINVHSLERFKLVTQYGYQFQLLVGEWVIQSVQSPVTYTINDGKRTKTVHINRLRPRLQRSTLLVDQSPHHTWEPPSVEHITYDESNHQPRYPTRVRQPPDRYRP